MCSREIAEVERHRKHVRMRKVALDFAPTRRDAVHFPRKELVDVSETLLECGVSSRDCTASLQAGNLDRQHDALCSVDRLGRGEGLGRDHEWSLRDRCLLVHGRQ